MKYRTETHPLEPNLGPNPGLTRIDDVDPRVAQRSQALLDLRCCHFAPYTTVWTSQCRSQVQHGTTAAHWPLTPEIV